METTDGKVARLPGGPTPNGGRRPDDPAVWGAGLLPPAAAREGRRQDEDERRRHGPWRAEDLRSSLYWAVMGNSVMKHIFFHDGEVTGRFHQLFWAGIWLVVGGATHILHGLSLQRGWAGPRRT